MLKVINIQDLRPGMMITQVVEQNGPVKIRKVGLVRSQDMLTGLAEMGVLKVEIDTEQSLELEPEAVPTSMTQKLLQGEFDHAQSVDSSLSESFNRSLFLPSVSQLPSMWQLYARQGGIAALVVMCGLSLGFAAAVLPPWVSQRLANTPNAEHVTADRPAMTIDAAAKTPSDVDRANTENNNTQQSNVQDIAVIGNVDSVTPQEQSANSISPADITTGSSGSVNSSSEAADNASEEEGRVLNPSQSEEVVSGVSAELLARFNQALEAIENEPADQTPETQVTVRSDIPRIDQLPARLLTRLPAMSFSAHMYASAPQNRWVRVNGQQLFESDWVNDQVQLINIEPQRVVLSFEGELFTMAALTDW
ncbi:general secretion pathway protein GspB [Alteromonas flava]|uniref:general secretion pathway protein GspB n=1 Tax=Alteromonas flava TaxID=2048003 RepID=UPI000C283418|nr:general secretion pathway protein GspB [Alteromonas flava]